MYTKHKNINYIKYVAMFVRLHLSEPRRLLIDEINNLRGAMQLEKDSKILYLRMIIHSEI